MAWILFVAAGVYALVLLSEKSRALEHAQSLERAHAALQKQLHAAAARIDALAKYETIPDAEAHVARMMESAKASIAARDAEAAQNAKRIRAEAEELKRAAQVAMQVGEAKAQQIIDDANAKARAIAGEALEARLNAKHFEETARAMRNVIDGYGDLYLVPTHGILDDLADEFGFAEAGQKLKAARERVRNMIKRDGAAACDYAERERRETAIHFVLDAFNGKVDSILADVRHDNLGTLEQKMRDAFHLVNQNGRAFRNARIEPDFLKARLEELRWAVTAHELKQREREEQRELRERLREEEKAQREYEKAMKEAEKEEETLRKAIEKTQREVLKATDEQRLKYEAKLAELGEKLRLAEEKNQRALSMAQQTRAGYVYVISNVGSFGEQVYKIGLTRRLEPLDRVRELGDASVPFEFDVHAMIRAEDAPALERELHKRFVRGQVNKVNPRKEFFRVPLEQIRKVTEEMGCQAAWTMTAECRQYKETLAIEKEMASKNFDDAAWVESQLKEHDELVTTPMNDVVEMAS